MKQTISVLVEKPGRRTEPDHRPVLPPGNTMIDYEFIPWKENRSCGSIRELNLRHGLKPPGA